MLDYCAAHNIVSDFELIDITTSAAYKNSECSKEDVALPFCDRHGDVGENKRVVKASGSGANTTCHSLFTNSLFSLAFDYGLLPPKRQHKKQEKTSIWAVAGCIIGTSRNEKEPGPAFPISQFPVFYHFHSFRMLHDIRTGLETMAVTRHLHLWPLNFFLWFLIIVLAWRQNWLCISNIWGIYVASKLGGAKAGSLLVGLNLCGCSSKCICCIWRMLLFWNIPSRNISWICRHFNWRWLY